MWLWDVACHCCCTCSCLFVERPPHDQFSKRKANCFTQPVLSFRKNYRRRIISKGLLHIYSYLLRPGGIIYTITDVEDLHLWTKFHCEKHPCFEQVTSTTILAEDSCIQLMQTETEESKKVDREGREKYIGVYKRVKNKDTLQSDFMRI